MILSESKNKELVQKILKHLRQSEEAEITFKQYRLFFDPLCQQHHSPECE